VCDVFRAIDWFVSINGCRIQVQSTLTLADRIQVQLTLTHSYTQLRHSLRPHRLQIPPTATLTDGIRVVLNMFTRTDRIQVLFTFTLTTNSGTVYVRTYDQLRYRLRSHLQTIKVLSTFTLTTNSGAVYVRT
jgi:hypothetical protein